MKGNHLGPRSISWCLVCQCTNFQINQIWSWLEKSTKKSFDHTNSILSFALLPYFKIQLQMILDKIKSSLLLLSSSDWILETLMMKVLWKSFLGLVGSFLLLFFDVPRFLISAILALSKNQTLVGNLELRNALWYGRYFCPYCAYISLSLPPGCTALVNFISMQVR